MGKDRQNDQLYIGILSLVLILAGLALIVCGAFGCELQAELQGVLQ